MALFPTTIPIGYETKLSPDAGKRPQLMEDGSIIILNFYGASTIWSGEIVIPWATQTERDTIVSFFNTNRDLVWTFQHPGDGYLYSLYFVNQPSESRLETYGDPRWKITMNVIGTRT